MACLNMLYAFRQLSIMLVAALVLPANLCSTVHISASIDSNDLMSHVDCRILISIFKSPFGTSASVLTMPACA